MLDRVDFGNTASEAAHAFNGGDKSTETAGVGAFAQSFRQPKLLPYATSPTTNLQKLSFKVAVDPAKQNYLTVRLWGSDSYFGVLRLLENSGSFADQLDSSMSNGKGNPPFVGRFHYATTTIPLSLTTGQTSVVLTLLSGGYPYDHGDNQAGKPSRPVYGAYTHVNPYFVPPSTDANGPTPARVAYSAPSAADRVGLYAKARGLRGNIFDVNNTDGAWHPGGWLFDKTAGVITAAMGAPPEVVGLRLGDGAVKASDIAYFNAQPNPADAWRDSVGWGGVGNQVQPLTVAMTAYLLKPFKNENGVVETGYDRYLDPAQLNVIVGVLDGLTRMQGSGGMWDSGCVGKDSLSHWAGLTSTPRVGGYWPGTKTREHAGCVSFEGEQAIQISRSVLRLLNDDPAAAAAFKVRLDQSFDADVNGVQMKRAHAYQRMLRNAQGFNLNTLTTTDNFARYGGTVYQTLIDIQNFYGNQLLIRQLQALYPNPDFAALDSATVRKVMRQVLGMDPNTYIQRPDGVGDWYSITRGGLAENYGTLSSGYDGRYGSGVPVKIGAIVALSKYDTSLTAAEKAAFVQTARNTIAAFDNFLYPQDGVSWNADGTFTVYDSFAQEDVISYRVPYGPNANGGGFNYNIQLDAVVPDGVIQSPLAKRGFLLATARDQAPPLENMAYYIDLEASWMSIAGVAPESIAPLPGEPGSPDFIWADVDSGAVALANKGERLFFNAHFNRPKGGVNYYVRVHHVTPTVDREATVMMPFDATTVQDDGNSSGADAHGAWVVRYGNYLVVLNPGKTDYTVQLPKGSGVAATLRSKRTVPMGSTTTVGAGSYEGFVLP